MGLARIKRDGGRQAMCKGTQRTAGPGEKRGKKDGRARKMGVGWGGEKMVNSASRCGLA